jgi:hypothetical protein
LGLLQNILGGCLIFKVNDQSVKLLVLNSLQRGFEITRSIQSNTERWQNFAQRIRRRIVARNQ